MASTHRKAPASGNGGPSKNVQRGSGRSEGNTTRLDRQAATAQAASLLPLIDQLQRHRLRTGPRHDLYELRRLIQSEPHRPLARFQLERIGTYAAHHLVTEVRA